ncbi:MAG: hypothetical protein UT14_C0017G0006 [Candidatus Shapirobacteria bacterium GW2011_GWE1_38_92]|uniref:Uncharacterized protein n=1 Tax=Candidatus Shapirobacteria bacterium GW2011_GWE1_38_92 TaxID=1618489 RepID=A0A0G0LTI0_9BACT|nr:MAG: hypothetical protein UT14_C0017G0006 [Candidatus Shapirobacteria bacterium GW2011_GWE1_38_92]
MNNKGQSIIEVVFSLGAAALVLMGAVVLRFLITGKLHSWRNQ